LQVRGRLTIIGLSLPKNLRKDFKYPRSIVYANFPRRVLESSPGIVCVGDVVSESCLKLSNLVKNITLVYDKSTRRYHLTKDITPQVIKKGYKLYRLVNPAGTITYNAFYNLCQIIRRGGKNAVLVLGEEDMLALVAIQCSPIGYSVLFGVPDKGVAVVKINNYYKLDASLRTLELKPSLIS
jgi:uncharacterized protein (UPF0218 family)